jgi:transposase InsO family protein
LALVGAFRSRVSLEAENTILRHQLNVLRRKLPKRPMFGMLDRLIFAGLYRLAPNVLGALAIVKPETVIKWHRAGFRSYWRWKSRRRGGRPTVAPEIRKLIREMSIANPLWGAPRIHGELLKLGIDIGQTSVAKYMAKRRDPPSQGWRTFLRNHADGIAAMDLFVVPTISFRLLYGLLIVGHGRRQILWFGVTAHPSAEWIANQITEACGWEQAPRYLIRDRDGAYGEVFIRRLRSMGIRDRPTSPRSPWQNGYAERLIGSIRRECLDHVVVFSERHLRHLLLCYMKQWGPHASIPGERCAGLARRRSRRAHSLPPNLGRTASPICPDLIYDRHSGPLPPAIRVVTSEVDRSVSSFVFERFSSIIPKLVCIVANKSFDHYMSGPDIFINSNKQMGCFGVECNAIRRLH